MHLHELWRTRVGLVLSLLIAGFVALTATYRISLLPPGLHARALGMASAETHVLVDNPNTVLLNLGVGSVQLEQMSQRALVLGNVMGSSPVRQYIAQRVGVPVQAIQVTTPTTPQYPNQISTPTNQRRTTDLVRSNDQYRINVQANPTVPMLDVYSEASNVTKAMTLANAAVDGLNEYLTSVARSQAIPASSQVRLGQLGRAVGGNVTGSGLSAEMSALVFLLVFALSAAASIFVARVMRGWKLSGDAQPRPPRSDLSGPVRSKPPEATRSPAV